MLFLTSISPIICFVALVMLPVPTTSNENTENSPTQHIASVENGLNSNDIQTTKEEVSDKGKEMAILKQNTAWT